MRNTPRSRFAALAGGTFLVIGLLGLVGHRGARAAGVLARFGGDPTSAVARYASVEVDVVSGVLEHAGRRLEADVTRPRGEIRGRLVLVHGMHHLGHREPRLVSLARSLAAAGIEVTTPRIESLAQYSLSRAAIADIGGAASAVASASGIPRVPVMGISFAGGIALLAAADPELGAAIGGVVALGAQHDLARVARWFAGEPALGPGGESTDTRPHPYGAQLFLREDAARFFGDADATLARELLLLCLHDDWRGARAREEGLSPEARRVLDESMRGRLGEETRSRLRAMVEARAEDLAILSPRGRAANVHVPVLLLHGAEDPIIPSTEAHHLARELPDARVLVTHALRHAESADDASAGEQLALVRFMDAVLALAEDAS